MLPDARLRVAALLNASAGTIKRQGAGTLRDVLASAFEKHGIAAALEFLPGSELGSAAERARQQVVDGKLDAIVVGEQQLAIVELHRPAPGPDGLGAVDDDFGASQRSEVIDDLAGGVGFGGHPDPLADLQLAAAPVHEMNCMAN